MLDLRILLLSSLLLLGASVPALAQEEDEGEEPAAEEAQSPSARRYGAPGRAVQKAAAPRKAAVAPVQGDVPAGEATSYEPGDESSAEPQAGGSAITQDDSAQGLSGAGGGRQDIQAQPAGQQHPNPPASAVTGGGGRGGGGSGGSQAGKFQVVDLDVIKFLGGHKELLLPPGAAWAIRFKARKVGNARGFHFGLETRTGSDGRIRVKSAVSSKPGVLDPGRSCESYYPGRKETVQQFPTVRVIVGKALKGNCALQEGAFYYYNVYSDGGCEHPGAIARGCPALFSISNGGMTFLAPGYKD